MESTDLGNNEQQALHNQEADTPSAHVYESRGEMYARLVIEHEKDLEQQR